MHPADAALLVGAATAGGAVALILRGARPWPHGWRGTPAAIAAAAAAVAACWLVMAMTARHYFVDVPRWDIWDAVDLIERQYDDRLAVADLLRPHNEHRPVTARLTILPNARLFHWNHWIEFALLLVVTAATPLLTARYVALTAVQRHTVSPLALVPLSLVGFSLVQWENLLRGYHVHIVIAVVATVAALFWLGTGKASWRRLVAAAGSAIVGALSFGSALLVWPLGLVAIVIRRGDAWAARAAAWGVAGALAVAWYRHGMPHRPGYSEVAVSSVLDVVRAAAGMLVGLAMPVTYVPEVFATSLSAAQWAVVFIPAAAGSVGLGLVWRRWREDRAGEQAWLFPALLTAFGAGSLLLAAFGRTAAGLYALTASRYAVHAVCFWAGIILLLAMRGERDSRRWRVTAAVLLTAIALAAAASWPRALPYMARDASSGRAAREALLRGDVGAAAPILYPDPIALERMRRVLEAHELSIYRPGSRR
jgi:hypothetical protein